MFVQPRRLRARQGFTLVELLVVIAILSILAAVAIPAYNNYTLKSKFTEVVVATAPTKAAISTCAATGDCIANNAIDLISGGAGGSAATSGPTIQPVSSNGLWPSNTPLSTAGALYAYELAVYEGFYPPGSGVSQAQIQTLATNQANNMAGSGWNSFLAFTITNGGNGPNEVCMHNIANNSGGCSNPVPLSQVLATYNPASDPLWSAADSATVAAEAAAAGTPMSLPCVGAAGCSPATKYAASVSYDASGNITATAQATSGLNAETFVLLPSYSSGRVDWAVSGTCKTRAGGALC